MLRCLYPNALSPDNELAAKQPLSLAAAGWRIDAGAQTGEVRLLALVTAEPLDLMYENKQPDGPFFRIEVGEENLARLEALLTHGSYAAASTTLKVSK